MFLPAYHVKHCCEEFRRTAVLRRPRGKRVRACGDSLDGDPAVASCLIIKDGTAMGTVAAVMRMFPPGALRHVAFWFTTDLYAPEMEAAWQLHPELETLEVYGVADRGDIDPTADILSVLRPLSLRHLRLHNLTIPPDQVAAICDAVAGMPSLEVLDLIYVDVRPAGAAALGRALRALPALRELSLAESNLTGRTLGTLADAMGRPAGLRVLDLSDAFVDGTPNDYAPAQLARIIQQLPGLQTIYLRLPTWMISVRPVLRALERDSSASVVRWGARPDTPKEEAVHWATCGGSRWLLRSCAAGFPGFRPNEEPSAYAARLARAARLYGRVDRSRRLPPELLVPLAVAATGIPEVLLADLQD